MRIVTCDAEQGLVLQNREGIIKIFFEKLEYVEVINKTVSFHLTDGAVREVTAALGDFEKKLLERPEFLKIHRSYLVNLNYIEAIDINGIVTKSGQSIPLSRLRRSQVQEAYVNFLNREKPLERTNRADAAWRILLVDDEPSEGAFWADILRAHGCIVRLSRSGEEALELAAKEQYDCVLLDVMLSSENGFSVCEKLHRQTSAPVIFLSCVTEPDRQVEGFAAGGIDYITKDTSAALFWAKVETRIRLSVSERTTVSYGALSMDLTQRRVTVGGNALPLTSTEFDILWKLSEQAGHVFTPKEIFDAVWDGQPWDGGQTVQIHMSRLRRKLERACEGHSYIETVWGQGYRFVPADDAADIK